MRAALLVDGKVEGLWRMVRLKTLKLVMVTNKYEVMYLYVISIFDCCTDRYHNMGLPVFMMQIYKQKTNNLTQFR